LSLLGLLRKKTVIHFLIYVQNMRLSERNNRFETEKELVAALVKNFKQNRMEVRTEVQLFERFIDIIAFNEFNLLAIEAKINSPSRAFRQAFRYKIISDYTYVALPKNKSNIRAIQLAEETGIGLLLVTKDGDQCTVETAIESKISEFKDINIMNYIMELNR
jgi:hypothetical protein